MTSGDAVELWAMKTLAGLYASKIDFETPGYRFQDFDIPMDQIARQLSSERPRSILRMTIPLSEDQLEEKLGRRAVSVGPIIDEDTDRLLGLLIRLHGLSFHFYLDLENRQHAETAEIVRPDIIDMIGPERTSRIYLSWREGGSSGQIVQINVSHSRG